MTLIEYRFLVNIRLDSAGHGTSFLHGSGQVTGWRRPTKARLKHLLLISRRKTSIISRPIFYSAGSISSGRAT